MSRLRERYKILEPMKREPLTPRRALFNLTSQRFIPTIHLPFNMNNNSKTHAIVDQPSWRPKSKQWRRRNKAKAKPGALARQSALREALLAGN